MKIGIKTTNCPNLAKCIQVLRLYTGESMSVVKSNLAQGLALTVFDTLDDDGRENFLNLVNDLERIDCKLLLFDAENPEIELDGQFLQNQLELSDEISAQIGRENELWTTEIIAETNLLPELQGEFIFQKAGKSYYRFDYCAELVDLIKQAAQVIYYKRDRGDNQQENWEEVSADEILELMQAG